MNADISDERKAEIFDAYTILVKRGTGGIGTNEEQAVDAICAEYGIDRETVMDIVKQLS